MKKVISTILAMAMVLSMTAAFAIDPVENVGYDVESYTVYSEDFNTEEETPFYGTDIDIDIKPTRWEYVEVEEGNNAVKVTYEIPSFEEVLATLPEKPANEEEIEEGVTYKEDYTEEAYNATYGATKSGYLAVTGDKGAITSGTDAYVLDFDIYFPVIPEHGASVNIWNGMKQNGVIAVKPFMFSYVDTVNEDNEVVEEGTVFGFASGNELITEIKAETWYDCTQVVDIAERYVHYYINGELVNTVDIAAAGPITDRGYVRAVYTPFGLEEGFYLDNVHIYEANAEEVFNPYSYIASGDAALDFEGYTIDASIMDENSAKPTLLNVVPSVAKNGVEWKVVKDPKGSDTDVLEVDTTNVDTSDPDVKKTGYINVGGLNSNAKYTFAEGNAAVYSTDLYIENAETLTQQQSLIMMAAIHGGKRTIYYLYLTKASNDALQLKWNDTGSNFATLSENEWHNIQLVMPVGSSNGYVYVDGNLVNTRSFSNGAFEALDYIRIQTSSAPAGKYYLDNWHVYEATETACAITVSDYIAGTSKVGAAVPIVAKSYIAGETATIQKSEDGLNWEDFSGVEAILTKTTTYYRAKLGEHTSAPILLYGAAGSDLTKTATIYDVDFEPVEDKPYTIGERDSKLYYPDGTKVTNPDGGAFGITEKIATVIPEGGEQTYRTAGLVAAPTDYANSANIGTTVLNLTGDGRQTSGGNSQFNITLAKGDNSYPGSTVVATKDGDGVLTQLAQPANAKDVYVTEFDFAIDKYVDSTIEVAGFRSNGNTTKYAPTYWILGLNKDGKLSLNGTESSQVIEPKTWYTIKIVAYAETGIVETYVNGVLVGEKAAPSNSGSLVWWDSFRLYGGTKNQPTTEVVYYDNMNFYIAQVPAAPTTADIKLGTIVYKSGTTTVNGMGDYDDLKITATLTNNGVADDVVCVFALYEVVEPDVRILKALDVVPVTLGKNEAKVTVTSDTLGASETNDVVKVFLWDNLGSIAPTGEIIADNAEL